MRRQRCHFHLAIQCYPIRLLFDSICATPSDCRHIDRYRGYPSCIRDRRRKLPSLNCCTHFAHKYTNHKCPRPLWCPAKWRETPPRNICQTFLRQSRIWCSWILIEMLLMSLHDEIQYVLLLWYMRCASQHKLFVWQLCRCARTPFGCISSRLWYSYLIVIFNWLHCCCAHVFVWPIYHENHKTKSSISCSLSFRNTRQRVSVCVSTSKCLWYHLSQQKYLFLSRLHGIRLVVHSFLSLSIVHCILIHKRISSLIPCAI